MGVLKWGLKATVCNLCTIACTCALLWPVVKVISVTKMTTYRQSWTIMGKYLKHPFAKAPFRLSRLLDISLSRRPQRANDS